MVTTAGLGSRRAIDLLTARRIDPKPLLKQSGLAGLDLTNRDLMVPAEAEARFIELAARASDSPEFGICMAEGTDPRDAGLLYYLFNASATLRQAVTLLAQYIVIGNASLQLRVAFSSGADAVARLDYVGLPRRHLKHAAEYHLAVIVRILREIARRPISPALVTFAHHRSFGVREVERYFSCPVRFDAPSDRLEFSNETLDIPVAAADERLLGILKPYCDRVAAQRGDRIASLRLTVENEILKLLPRGEARIDAIANALGASSRSLARRLAEEGTTFSDVLDDLRRALALQYVAEPNLSADQIAALLGYGDAGSLSHAFRRWTGASPSQVRGDPLIRSKVLAGREA
ncbi:AraC family transcriptional regulator [Roseiarcus fermentans]|uniref:AraC family transcriptional regulator n=1 Tax=Roseiarcus fermentans TaxID=1473586 RepID=A0A366EM31_9HYPH|nr:AraC family transcriptional regulator [Roseiarcus fermentans]